MAISDKVSDAIDELETAYWNREVNRGCIARAALVAAIEAALDARDARIADLTADYLARHKTACDRFEEIARLTAALAQAEAALQMHGWQPLPAAPASPERAK